MRKKSDVILPVIAVFLVVVIGAGIWVLVGNRQPHTPSQDAPEQTKEYTMSEVAQHSSKEDCWTVISGSVYDLTGFVNRHPGGDEILRACGTDATTLFTKRQTQEGQAVGSGSPHSQAASEQLAKLKIGILVKE
jgi:cytochrome b involved in lipid metabolism